MNIIERGRAFAQSLRELAGRTRGTGSAALVWHNADDQEWQLPAAAVFLSGRQTVRVQRHLCHGCGKSYASGRRCWWGELVCAEVHRAAVDHCSTWEQPAAHSRGAALVDGRQERWQLWRPLDDVGGERCYLAASTVQRWLDRAGQRAQASVDGQLRGIARRRNWVRMVCGSRCAAGPAGGAAGGG